MELISLFLKCIIVPLSLGAEHGEEGVSYTPFLNLYHRACWRGIGYWRTIVGRKLSWYRREMGAIHNIHDAMDVGAKACGSETTILLASHLL